MPHVEPWPEGGLERLRNCPACGGTRRALLHDELTDQNFRCAPGRWTLYRCIDCTAAFLDPRPTLETIGLAYSTYFTHVPLAADQGNRTGSLREALKNGYLNHRFGYSLRPSASAGSLALKFFPLVRRRAEMVVRHLAHRENGSLLDVGCGNGEFLAFMRTQGWRVRGLDVDPAAVDAAHRAGLEVEQGGLDDCDLPAGTFDAISLNHVIEHLHDPLTALRRCLRLAKPGGQLYICTPNIDSIGHTYFGRYFYALDPPRHLVLFTASALGRMCRSAGWDQVQVSAGLGAFGISTASRSVRARATLGLEHDCSRTLSDETLDRFFDFIGYLAHRRSQNLVAIAIKTELPKR